MELFTGDNDRGRRLDRVLRKALPDLPLALIHRLLRQGQVFIDGKAAKAQDRFEKQVTITIPSMKDQQKSINSSKINEFDLHNEGFKEQKHSKPGKNLPPLEIIWEDAGLMAVNKPVGLAVHGPESLDTMVQAYLEGKLPASLSFRAGPLHRLDKPSSGIVVFSTSLDGARLFTSLLRERKVRKTYLAIVEGSVEKEEIWEDDLVRDKEKKKTFVKEQTPKGCRQTCGSAPILNAVTKVTPLAVKGGYSLLQAEIATGRTHQIRAQAAAHGHPLAGDLKYKEQRVKNREQRIENKEQRKEHLVEFFLHARRLEFLDYIIEAPMPEKFRSKVEEIFGCVPQ